MLREQERFQSLVRRYESPDEYPFFPDAIQFPILQPLDYPRILHPNDVDVNQTIKKKYLDLVLPRVCRRFGREDRGEKQENYGSAATCDVACLQALSRRIHFGKFVAESKFQQETERFVKLIRQEDREGIDAAITNAKVEKKVLERLGLKARTYGTDPSVDAESEGKINVDAVVAMYEVSRFIPTARTYVYISLLIQSGNRHTINQGSGGGIPYAAAERDKVGVGAQGLKIMLQRIGRRNKVPFLAQRKVFLQPLQSCFKLVGFN